jgi:putative hydrolase of the HAD superfamily|tara:strand:- start:1059 stop:1685 length:627 start_codon:yes stop_codon:yes gene_type:complete
LDITVFDVVGTLIVPCPQVSHVYMECGKRHGIDIAESEIAEKFSAAWRQQDVIDSLAELPFKTSEHRERERWRLIVEDVFDGHPSSRLIFDELWCHFADPCSWRPLEEGMQKVSEVEQAGGLIALASNFDYRLFQIAKSMYPLTSAKYVFTSSELGWRKPAINFFRAIEHRLGRRPEELTLVGDDPELDIAAARKAGWHAHSIAITSS